MTEGNIVREAKELEARICHFLRAFLAYREPSGNFTHSFSRFTCSTDDVVPALGKVFWPDKRNTSERFKSSRGNRRFEETNTTSSWQARWQFLHSTKFSGSKLRPGFRFSVFFSRFLSSSTSLYCKTSSASWGPECSAFVLLCKNQMIQMYLNGPHRSQLPTGMSESS